MAAEDKSNRGGVIAFTLTFIATAILFFAVFVFETGPIDTQSWSWGNTFSETDADSRWAQWQSSSPEAVDRGGQLYASNCVFCHGGKNIDDDPVLARLKQGRSKAGTGPANLYKIIYDGIPGTSMKAMSFLAANDRWALVHFVRSQVSSPDTSSDEEMESLPF